MCKIISEKELRIEIASQRSTLDFSQTKKGPGCEGCCNLVFSTVCGHAYTSRQRCEARALVCAGSEILTVQVQDVVLKRTNCTVCRFSKIDSHGCNRWSKRRRAQTPQKAAAKLRLDVARERWRRQCLESGLADKKRPSSKRSVNPKASDTGKADQANKVDPTEEQRVEEASSYSVS